MPDSVGVMFMVKTSHCNKPQRRYRPHPEPVHVQSKISLCGKENKGK